MPETKIEEERLHLTPENMKKHIVDATNTGDHQPFLEAVEHLLKRGHNLNAAPWNFHEVILQEAIKDSDKDTTAYNSQLDAIKYALYDRGIFPHTPAVLQTRLYEEIYNTEDGETPSELLKQLLPLALLVEHIKTSVLEHMHNPPEAWSEAAINFLAETLDPTFISLLYGETAEAAEDIVQACVADRPLYYRYYPLNEIANLLLFDYKGDDKDYTETVHKHLLDALKYRIEHHPEEIATIDPCTPFDLFHNNQTEAYMWLLNPQAVGPTSDTVKDHLDHFCFLRKNIDIYDFVIRSIRLHPDVEIVLDLALKLHPETDCHIKPQEVIPILAPLMSCDPERAKAGCISLKDIDTHLDDETRVSKAIYLWQTAVEHQVQTDKLKKALLAYAKKVTRSSPASIAHAIHNLPDSEKKTGFITSLEEELRIPSPFFTARTTRAPSNRSKKRKKIRRQKNAAAMKIQHATREFLTRRHASAESIQTAYRAYQGKRSYRDERRAVISDELPELRATTALLSAHIKALEAQLPALSAQLEAQQLKAGQEESKGVKTCDASTATPPIQVAQAQYYRIFQQPIATYSKEYPIGKPLPQLRPNKPQDIVVCCKLIIQADRTHGEWTTLSVCAGEPSADHRQYIYTGDCTAFSAKFTHLSTHAFQRGCLHYFALSIPYDETRHCFDINKTVVYNPLNGEPLLRLTPQEPITLKESVIGLDGLRQTVIRMGTTTP